jgi:hypothetical protein
VTSASPISGVREEGPEGELARPAVAPPRS